MKATRETCALCEASGTDTALIFVGTVRGEVVQFKVEFCERHSGRALKHLKRFIPASLMEDR